MAAYIGTPTDVAIELDAKDQQLVTDRVERALRRATNQLVGELGWDPRQSERTIRVDGARAAFLPATRVTAATYSPWAIGAVLDETGVVRFGHRFTGTITYTAGWPPEQMPEALAEVVAEWAADRLDSSRRLRSWSTGDESETYAVVTSGAGGGDPRLDPYRLPPAVA